MDVKNSEFTDEEKQLIQDHFQDLLQSARMSQSEEDKALITKAFNLANGAHANMRRKSGEPYILHPIAVAKIATTEIGLGTKSIVSALLHDVVEDTDFTVEDIRLQFGDKIANIVDGLTKIAGVFDGQTDLQAENFKKIIMTMADDLRVIFIKLADRLHNMRTLDSMPPNKQLKIASETLFIYAPLAHRLGLYSIKTELEDLCLKYHHPFEYQRIASFIKASEQKRFTYINRFSLPITARLNAEKYTYEITGRPKSIYSIWHKMETKKVPLEEIYDLFAIRIIFDPDPNIPEKTQCWAIYSIITDLYTPRPDRIRDWISQPKSNGYEALHTTVMGPGGQWVEVQIRSRRMNDIAEHGYAAHWKYKENTTTENELDKWIFEIRKMLEDPKNDAFDFLDEFKLNLFASEITVFTPKGESVTLPAKSTVLDFAFEIHSQVGYHAYGAKVNHKLVSLNQELNAGDQIEILTSEKQQPEPEWIDYVTTAKARNTIKSFFKDQRRNVSTEGKLHLEWLLEQTKMQINSNIFRKLYNHFQTRNKDELYFKLGTKKITVDEFKNIMEKRSLSKWMKFWGISRSSSKIDATKKFDKSKPLVVDDNTQGYQIASCCNPIPGDDVIGYRIADDELIIHSTSCPYAIKLSSSDSSNVVKVEWTSHKMMAYLGRIKIKGVYNSDAINKVTKTITNQLDVNLRAINIDCHDGIFEGTIDVYVHNNEFLTQIIKDLSKIKGMSHVTRDMLDDKAETKIEM
ncbi:MAG: bifunctional (p)ppGpp synthetase/guanosine-3',5'-bis(diphosphate) 3'-pyrophosphohydrolase [Salinivirgaceae bacterium]|nr:bifunctional (p)ppGpp synthetase/guanosine-3',5'-bis(diphosphate) 3'-pyrophosphohydrolase [Salinivirgaceae bacterium]